MTDDQPQITRRIAAECDEWRTKCGALAAECERLEEENQSLRNRCDRTIELEWDASEKAKQAQQECERLKAELVERDETIKNMRQSLEYMKVTIANLKATQSPSWATDAARVWNAKRGGA